LISLRQLEAVGPGIARELVDEVRSVAARVGAKRAQGKERGGGESHRPHPDTLTLPLQMTFARPGVDQTSYAAGSAGSAAGLELGLDLRAASFVDDLTAHGVAGVGEAVAGGRQRATYAVSAFADHHLDGFRALAEDADLDLLAGAGEADFDFL